jgi:hypothetical protein
MTSATRSTRLADRGRTMHALVVDDQGRLTLQRLRPWHRMLARIPGHTARPRACSVTRPEASASLAARAVRRRTCSLVPGQGDLALAQGRVRVSHVIS